MNGSRCQNVATGHRGFNYFGFTAACGVVLLLQVSGVPEAQLLVSLYPGVPTTAELFILPDQQTSGEHKRSGEEALETVSKYGPSNEGIAFIRNRIK